MAESKLQDVLEQVKSSCQTFLQSCVRSDASIRPVQLNFSSEIVQNLKDKLLQSSTNDGPLIRKHVHYPLRFESDREMLNFVVTLHLVNFGSYVIQDPQDTDYAQDGILWSSLRGCMGMHLSGSKFAANWYSGISSHEIESWFGLSRTADRRILGKDSPVYQSEDSNEKPLIENLEKVLNDAGRVLLSFRAEDFFEFLDFPTMFADARRANAPDEDDCYVTEVSVSELLSKLVKNLYGFKDMYRVQLEENGQLDVWILSKAQKLMMQLASIEVFTFEGRKYKLHWADADRLTIGVDNDVVRALIHLGVLEVSGSVKEKLHYQVDERSGLKVCPDVGTEFECEVRCTALEACLKMLDYLSEDSGLKFASPLDRVALLEQILWQTALKSKSPSRGILNKNSAFF
jgi:succinate dehydrogenase flavin-adding protein (antitoxin of CptAB toxin-antitoxin module)